MALHGLQAWSHIASMMPGRLSKQVRERWVNHLDPGVIKGGWTPEEDAIILRLIQEHGTQWKLMTPELPGRTDNAIKNRWHSHVKKNGGRDLDTAAIFAKGSKGVHNGPKPNVSCGDDVASGEPEAPAARGAAGTQIRRSQRPRKIRQLVDMDMESDIDAEEDAYPDVIEYGAQAQSGGADFEDEAMAMEPSDGELDDLEMDASGESSSDVECTLSTMPPPRSKSRRRPLPHKLVTITKGHAHNPVGAAHRHGGMQAQRIAAFKVHRAQRLLSDTSEEGSPEDYQGTAAFGAYKAAPAPVRSCGLLGPAPFHRQQADRAPFPRFVSRQACGAQPFFAPDTNYDNLMALAEAAAEGILTQPDPDAELEQANDHGAGGDAHAMSDDDLIPACPAHAPMDTELLIHRHGQYQPDDMPTSPVDDAAQAAQSLTDIMRSAADWAAQGREEPTVQLEKRQQVKRKEKRKKPDASSKRPGRPPQVHQSPAVPAPRIHQLGIPGRSPRSPLEGLMQELMGQKPIVSPASGTGKVVDGGPADALPSMWGAEQGTAPPANRECTFWQQPGMPAMGVLPSPMLFQSGMTPLGWTPNTLTRGAADNPFGVFGVSPVGRGAAQRARLDLNTL